MAVSKFQTFQAVTIERASIKNAPYNPRIINKENQKGLKKIIKKHGLVETLVFNKRTGNLVGGHQRLSQLDSLEKNNNYSLTVAQIDVSEKQEKEINLALNNPSIQGEYDIEILKDIFKDIDIDATGFTEYDMNIFMTDVFVDTIYKEDNSVNDVKKSIEDIKLAKKKSKDKNISKGENYIVVTFLSIEAKESFLKSLNHNINDRYISGELLLNSIK